MTAVIAKHKYEQVVVRVIVFFTVQFYCQDQ